MTPDRLIIIQAKTTATGFDIVALADGSDAQRLRCPVNEFFLELARTKRVLLKKLHKQLELTAQQGPSPNTEKFRHLKGGAYDGIIEFKAKADGAGGVRLFGFFDGERVIICTHAAEKGNDREMEQEYARVARMYSDYRRITKNTRLPTFP